MVTKVEVNGLEECLAAVEEHNKDGARVFVLCTGSNDAEGSSWCIDCRVAKPKIEAALASNGNDKDVFITCAVGDRDAWKTPENAFRKHDGFRLSSIPTLFVWGTQMKLVEADCANDNKLALLFEE